MKLSIRNFAKILRADIEIDGITIIAGNNNIGKSTIGKTLDAVFNATYNIDEKMNNARIDSLSHMLRNEIEQNRYKHDLRFRHYTMRTYSEFAKVLLECESAEREEICRKYEERMLEESFHGEINSLYDKEGLAEIVLSIKEKDIRLIFKKDECIEEKHQFEILNNSIYIDDPFVIDEMNHILTFGISELSLHKRNILRKLIQKEDKEVEEKAFSDLLVANKLEDIIKIINRVAAGKVVKKQKYMYQFADDSSKELDVASLSTGVKAFLILKQLLLNGNLSDKDVIVLDEPEIHLHPEWQLLYAETIVLLQKKFDFHIVVTTHSAHFMEALELYSKKYEISERCNYYLADMQENGAVFENVTKNISKIYKQMVDPTLLLSRLREELETEDDEL